MHYDVLCDVFKNKFTIQRIFKAKRAIFADALFPISGSAKQSIFLSLSVYILHPGRIAGDQK